MATKNEWWRGAVLYQIYPRSFFDSNNDGIGDLPGITQKLDYVASLGVEGVWLSPFFTSPMKDFGYDVSDYKNIAPLFGTMDDFDVMLKEMHKRGLKLIIDLVLNHTSEEHPWFKESRSSDNNPKADWYVWADAKPDGTPPNNWMSVFGGSAWQFDTKRGQYYWHQFLKEQPDLNVRNPVVQDALLETAEWWLKKGVDGFRLDALNHCIHDGQLRDNPPKEGFDRKYRDKRHSHPYYWQRHLYDKTQPEMIPFLKKLRALTEKYDARMMVAEIGDDNQVATSIAYTNGPELLHMAYSFALLRPDYSANFIRGVVEEYIRTPNDSWPCWAFSNHDVVRTASRWAIDGKIDPRQVKMLIALLTSLRGTAFIYQGEELGLSEADIPFEKLQDPYGKYLWPEDKGRDGCRTPMPWQSASAHGGFSSAEPWLPVPPDHLARAVDAAEKDKASTLNFTRSFLNWRKGQQALRTGSIAFENTGDNVLGFTRAGEDGKTLCLFNFTSQPQIVKLPYAAKALDGHGLEYALSGDSVTLPAFGGFFGRADA